jgi:GSH-dependent disulfide-bond oxidoreductase
MIDLYALTSPNVQKIFVALEEMELAYNIIPVDVWKGENHKPEFRKINPNGRIPAIVDHDGPGGKPYAVFESGAILMYLGDKTGKFFPKDTLARYDTIQWLMIQLTGVGPIFGQFTHYKRFAGAGANEYSMSRFQTEVRRLYDVLEGRLAQTAYLGGADYSIADIATFPWIRNHEFQNVKLADLPNVSRWFKAVGERAAVKRALAKVDGIQTARDSAAPEVLDKLFGRGAYARA